MPKICAESNCKHNVFSRGYCRMHAYLAPPKEKREPVDRGLFKREEPVVIKNSEMDKFFEQAQAEIIASGQRCWCCGDYIPNYYLRHAVAHIFPKSIFKSVATHPLNWVCACAKNGCHDKTHVIDNFVKLPIFKEAVERYEQFKHLITENHKYKNLFEEAVKRYYEKQKFKS